MKAQCCGHQMVAWSEPSMLVIEPDWWPEGLSYNPPTEEASHLLCLRCGRHNEDVRVDI